MALPSEVKGRYTVSLRVNGHSASARYAAQGDRLICLGDERLAGVADGERVEVTIGEIGGHGFAARFQAAAREVASDEVDDEALGRLLEHVPLGRTLEEVTRGLQDARRTRRFLALTPG